MPNKFSKITLFEVNKNLSSNLEHWMQKRGTPMIKGDNKEVLNHSYDSGFKSYVRAVYSLAFNENRFNLLDQYNEYFKEDIDFYNSSKVYFYRGGEN